MTDFTPGPWFVDRINDSSFGICSDANVENSDIAVVHHRHRSNKNDPFFSKAREARANANLMAAAPDLLRELKVMVEQYAPSPDDWIDARAAIAKAEGATE
jgi:hypothetical protein